MTNFIQEIKNHNINKALNLEMVFRTSDEDFNKSIDEVADTLNKSFLDGLVDEQAVEIDFKNLDAILEKARPHKYYKREGSPGNYKYYYTKEEYEKEKKKVEGGKEKDTKSGMEKYAVKSKALEGLESKFDEVFGFNKKNDTISLSDLKQVIQENPTLANLVLFGGEGVSATALSGSDNVKKIADVMVKAGWKFTDQKVSSSEDKPLKAKDYKIGDKIIYTHKGKDYPGTVKDEFDDGGIFIILDKAVWVEKEKEKGVANPMGYNNTEEPISSFELYDGEEYQGLTINNLRKVK